MGITIIVSNYYDDFDSLLWNDWSSGAKHTLERIQDAGKEQEFMDLLVSVYENGVADDMEIDDFINYDEAWICKQLGIKDEREDVA